MNLLSTNKLGAISLIVGPVMAFVAFLLQPGGMLIEPVSPSDGQTMVAVWQASAALVKITAGFIMLGLMLMAFGLYEVHVAHRSNPGDGLSMAGLAALSLGIIAWLITQALGIALSSSLATPATWDSVFLIRTFISLTGGVAVGLGVFFFAASVLVETRSGVLGILTWVAAVAGAVNMVAMGWGIFDTHSLDTASSIGRGMYIFYVVWLIALGLRLHGEEETQG